MTQTIETAPAGVVQLPEPCWELVYADTGRSWDPGSDGTPHYASRADAEAEVEVRNDLDEPPLRAAQLAAPCWEATSACGLPFENDIGIAHWSALNEAMAEMRDCDWSVVDGTLRCEDGNDCTAAANDRMWSLRCATSGVDHRPATVLVDGEPRCDSCADTIAGDDSSRRAPLPGTVA